MNKLVPSIFAFAVAALTLSLNVLAQSDVPVISPYYEATAQVSGSASGFASAADGGVATVTVQVNDGAPVIMRSIDGNVQFQRVEAGNFQAVAVEGGVPVFAGAEGGGPVAVSTMMVMRNDGGEGGESFMVQADGETFVWNSGIADMLNATPGQREELRKVIQDFRTQRPQGVQGPQAMSQRLGEMRKQINQVMRPEQRTRFGEVTFQLAGGLDSRFLNERTLEILDLTDAQKEQIKAITAARTAEAANAIREFDFRNATQEERAAFMEKLNTGNAERTKKYAEQIKAVLTPEQKAKAEKLTAEAPALREKLGMAREGLGIARQGGLQAGQTQGQQRVQAPIYTPGEGSWQPGQGIPGSVPATPQNSRGFPRGEN